jgi:hypothetical protein
MYQTRWNEIVRRSAVILAIAAIFIGWDTRETRAQSIVAVLPSRLR